MVTVSFDVSSNPPPLLSVFASRFLPVSHQTSFESGHSYVPSQTTPFNGPVFMPRTVTH